MGFHDSLETASPQNSRTDFHVLPSQKNRWNEIIFWDTRRRSSRRCIVIHCDNHGFFYRSCSMVRIATTISCRSLLFVVVPSYAFWIVPSTYLPPCSVATGMVVCDASCWRFSCYYRVWRISCRFMAGCSHVSWG